MTEPSDRAVELGAAGPAMATEGSEPGHRPAPPRPRSSLHHRSLLRHRPLTGAAELGGALV